MATEFPRRTCELPQTIELSQTKIERPPTTFELPPSTTELPRDFVDFRNYHAGATLIVCGCGESLTRLDDPERFITIGVNDVGRRLTPDYLVVLNERRQFSAERYAHVEASRAPVLVTQLDREHFTHPRVLRFRLGRRGGTAHPQDDTLDYTNNSPYVAVNLARFLGARRIGLLGVDFGDRHFFGHTGTHTLARQLARIDAEYGALGAACQAEGVELVNLSPTSRLRSLPVKDLESWAQAGQSEQTTPRSPRVFFVHYRFLSCGTVFDTGLREAADALGIKAEHADWDAADLDTRIAAFRPDLLFVVHGRRFVQRWRDRLAGLRLAVWLVDEPYEVDDTASWSGQFDVVFVNDASTVARHRNAHDLPVAYAPALHYPGDAPRTRHVGFIGGGNPSRERMLGALADAGQLDYVVGGPWGDPRVAARCISSNVSPSEAADLYRDTRIVINVFRDRHHYNRDAAPALAPNPRIFEALACGAVVVSTPRPGLHALLPELPTYQTEAEAVALVRRLLADPAACERIQQACLARIRQSRYADRLARAMEVALGWRTAWTAGMGALRSAKMDLQARPRQLQLHGTPPPSHEQPQAQPQAQPHTRTRDQPLSVSRPTDARLRGVLSFDSDWDAIGPVVHATHDGLIVIDPGPQRGPAFERGLASRQRFDAIDLTFEVRLSAGACLIAKVHQQHQIDQSSNSYHLMLTERRAYLARHEHVFRQIDPPGQEWLRLRMVCADGMLTLFRNGKLLHRVRDALLHDGFAFMGAQGGTVYLRALRIATTGTAASHVLSGSRVDPMATHPGSRTADGSLLLATTASARPSTWPQSSTHHLTVFPSTHRSAGALIPVQTPRPRLSIVTTVYDRVDCLRRCIASVQRLAFTDYEHLIVADHPPPEVVATLHDIVDAINDPRVGFYNLPERHNDWGIAPAAAGLRMARGEYLAFLSDDNGYTPDHVSPLIRMLERDPALGFVYCSCRYDGRLVLNHPVPRPGRIDLGQPLFRREVFEVHLNDDLPFDMMAWDWHLVDTLMRRGVRWKHVDRQTFLFRLAKYPELWAS